MDHREQGPNHRCSVQITAEVMPQTTKTARQQIFQSSRKTSFQVIDGDEDEGVGPHHAFLLIMLSIQNVVCENQLGGKNVF